MNEIEQMFYDAFESILANGGDSADPMEMMGLYPQFVVGIYKVDFVAGNCAIEIDGHEAHKTKEQREYDYKRERYLIRNGFVPVRFMGTEVYLDAEKCVTEAFAIAVELEMKDVRMFQSGVMAAEKRARGDACAE